MSRCIHSVPISDPCVKCALANPAPQIQANGEKSEPGGLEVRSSLISDLNAPVDPEKWARAKMLMDSTVGAAVMLERARIRAIVMRLMGNEWSANQLLEEIGE